MINAVHRVRRPAAAARRRTAARFLDRPYASVQLLLLASAGLLGFGMLMAVSTTIAASHAADGGSTGTIWTQVVKEGWFLAIGLPLFWFAMRLSPRAYRALAYPCSSSASSRSWPFWSRASASRSTGRGAGSISARCNCSRPRSRRSACCCGAATCSRASSNSARCAKARHLFLPLVPGFVFVIALVMLEPDLGTTLCYLLILLGLLWMVGMPIRYFALVVGLVAAGVTALAVAEPYRLQRLTSFTDPFKDAQGSGFHTVESLYALGSGGIFGVGLGDGTSKYWVPNSNSDYVFAIIGEELGLLGAVVVLALFALFAYTGIRVARRSADPFARLVAGAATIWICGQAVINIGYVTALLPVTGIPLPFISAGGTSLLASFFVLGMLVSFARHEAPAVSGAPRPTPRPPLPRAALAAHTSASALPPAQTKNTIDAGRRSQGDHPRDERSREEHAARASAASLRRWRARRETAPLPADGSALIAVSGSPSTGKWMVTVAARIVVAGGHSAGHIEPAMNFADAVRRLTRPPRSPRSAPSAGSTPR